MSTRYIKEWFYNVFAWGAITNLYVLAVLTNMEMVLTVAGLKDEVNEDQVANYFLSGYQYLEATILGWCSAHYFF